MLSMVNEKSLSETAADLESLQAGLVLPLNESYTISAVGSKKN